MASETKQCPLCGEEILAVAIKCKHCGSDLTEKATDAPAPAAAAADSGETIGNLLLLVPVLGTLLIWFWVGSMNMLQSPASSLSLVGIGTIIITAILAGYEANQLGFGKNTTEKKENSPTAYFLFVLLLWIVGYPLYLYHRSKKGKKNLIVGGIFIALAFALSWYAMGTAIEDKINELRGLFNR